MTTYNIYNIYDTGSIQSILLIFRWPQTYSSSSGVHERTDALNDAALASMCVPLFTLFISYQGPLYIN